MDVWLDDWVLTAKALRKTVAVGAGKSTTVRWTFTAGKADRPYILMFQPDGDRAGCLDVTGPITR